MTLGSIYLKQRKFDKALDSYDRYKGISAEIVYLKSVVYFSQLKFPEAWDEVNQAINMHEMFGDKASNTRLESPSSTYAIRAVLQAIQGLCIQSRNDLKLAESLNRSNSLVEDSTTMVNKFCLGKD